jgi:hypothetical protein
MQMKRWFKGWWCPIVLNLSMKNQYKKKKSITTTSTNVIVKRIKTALSSGCQCEF